MILVDTSVWVDHLRRADLELIKALESDAVLIHPFMIGELACGNIRNRRDVLELLGALPVAPTASNDEALELIDDRRLMGSGIGLVDVHLLASVVIHGTARLWTRDKQLDAVAVKLKVSYSS